MGPRIPAVGGKTRKQVKKGEKKESTANYHVETSQRDHVPTTNADPTTSTSKPLETIPAHLYTRLKPTLCEETLERISSIPYLEAHSVARHERTQGTGEWLLRHEKYHEWRNFAASKILWLKGDPGVGKTKLVSTVIDDIIQKLKDSSKNEAIAYFYCDWNRPENRDSTKIMSSFVRQLSTLPEDDKLPISIKQILDAEKNPFPPSSLDVIGSQTLAALFSMYSQITLVVDALDQCDGYDHYKFTDVLDKFVAESPKPVKILISSRRHGSLIQFKDCLDLEIEGAEIQDDIAMYLKHEVTTSRFQGLRRSGLTERVCELLMDRSGGMFRWVALQLDALCRLSCNRPIMHLSKLFGEQAILEQLDTLPQPLETTYDEIYQKVQSDPVEGAPIRANRAIQWVMCSCRQLSPAELVAALYQDPDADKVCKDKYHCHEILDLCHNLLVIDRKSNVCRFSHSSVQPHLEKRYWPSGEPDLLAAKVCLTILTNDSATSERNTDDFLEYACSNWVTHLERLAEKQIVDDRLTVLLERFLGSTDDVSRAYQKLPHTGADIRASSGGSYGSLPRGAHEAVAQLLQVAHEKQKRQTAEGEP